MPVCFARMYLCVIMQVSHACVSVCFGCIREVGKHTQSTVVGNILMSTAKQEIGNTFKSLALGTLLGSQAKSPHQACIACDRAHRGIALFSLRTEQQSRGTSHLRTESVQVVPIKAA